MKDQLIILFKKLGNFFSHEAVLATIFALDSLEELKKGSTPWITGSLAILFTCLTFIEIYKKRNKK